MDPFGNLPTMEASKPPIPPPDPRDIASLLNQYGGHELQDCAVQRRKELRDLFTRNPISRNVLIPEDDFDAL
jgi:hypothetical protein